MRFQQRHNKTQQPRQNKSVANEQNIESVR